MICYMLNLLNVVHPNLINCAVIVLLKNNYAHLRMQCDKLLPD